jgi:hypothetical protein
MRLHDLSRLILAAPMLSACGGLETASLFSSTGDASSFDAAVVTDSGVVILPLKDAGLPPVREASTIFPDVGTTKDVSVVIPMPEAAPPPPMMSVACPTGTGDNMCTGPAPVGCCVSQGINIGGGPQSATCEVPATPDVCQQSGGAFVQCASSADCPAGDQCCGTQNGDNEYTTVVCASQCSASQVQFCAQQASGECSFGTYCQQSQIIPPYTVCTGPGQ